MQGARDPVKSTSKGLVVGVVGAGQMALEAHLPVLLNVAGLRVGWIADQDRARARSAGRALRIAGHVARGDPDRLPEADLVLLAVPYG